MTTAPQATPRRFHKISAAAAAAETNPTSIPTASIPTAGIITPLGLLHAEATMYTDIAWPLPRQTIFDTLANEIPWEQRNVTIEGRTFPQPRLVAWFADDSLSYTYSGLTMKGLAWSPLLLQIKDIAEQISERKFNSMLANFYADGRKSIGMHADNEKELGVDPRIASISFGATRNFKLHSKPRGPRPIEQRSIPLANGSLLLMGKNVQKNYKHGIDKTTRPCGPRINLTFRTIVG